MSNTIFLPLCQRCTALCEIPSAKSKFDFNSIERCQSKHSQIIYTDFLFTQLLYS